MSQIMSHQDWMKLTDAGMTKPRSAELKQVDTALAGYHAAPGPQNQQKLSEALEKWIAGKGESWKSNVRNSRHAVENLRKQLSGASHKATAEEMVALSSVLNESRMLAAEFFRGKKLVFREGKLTQLAGAGKLGRVLAVNNIRGAVWNGTKLGKAAAEALPDSGGGLSAMARSKAMELLNELIPAQFRSVVISELSLQMPDFLQQWSAACAPFLGVGISGATTLAGVGKTIYASWCVHKAKVHAERSLSMETPEAAFQAIIRMLERERNQAAAGLAISTADLSAKLTGFFLDAGGITNTVSSFVAALANLAVLVGVVVRDVQEADAANTLMQRGSIGVELFQACPLMGAYFVLNVPTSVLVNCILNSTSFYAPGMMDRVERAVRQHIEPLREKARSLVDAHRMHIPSLFASVSSSHATSGRVDEEFDNFVDTWVVNDQPSRKLPDAWETFVDGWVSRSGRVRDPERARRRHHRSRR